MMGHDNQSLSLDASLLNALLLFLWRNGLPWQRYELLIIPLITTLGIIIQKASWALKLH